MLSWHAASVFCDGRSILSQPARQSNHYTPSHTCPLEQIEVAGEVNDTAEGEAQGSYRTMRRRNGYGLANQRSIFQRHCV